MGARALLNFLEGVQTLLRRQARIQGRVLGVKTPTIFGKLFQFAKEFQNPSLEKFLDTPLLGGLKNYFCVTLFMNSPMKVIFTNYVQYLDCREVFFIRI